MIRKTYYAAEILLILIQAMPVAARQTNPDPVFVIYETLYQGDVNAAYGQFRALAEREPKNLGASFGILMALHARGLQDARLQKEFEQRIDSLIETASARYDKSHQDTDALFYLEQSYLERAQYRVNFGKGIVGAARDGIKAKSYGDEYIKVDPGRADAYLAVGLYNYYVEIAPAFFKFLRFLLFMPAGNRVEGLKQIERVASGGKLWAPFAVDNLTDIYQSFENRPDEALRIAENLQKKYPENPEYRFQVAGLYGRPEVADYERAAQHYSTIIQRADQKHPNYKEDHRYQALLDLARMRQQQWRFDDAIAVITPAIDARVSQPDWVLPRFLLTRANYRALLADPHAADDAGRILTEAKWKSRQPNAQNLIKWIQSRRQSGEDAVFAELIPGNRLAAEHRWEEARQEYERVRAKRPSDWQVRYRLADLEFSRAEYNRAEAGLNPIVNSNPSTPAPSWVKADALLELARIYDIRGQRDQALKVYKKVIDDFAKEGAAQNARRGLVAPYKRLVTSAASQ